MSGKVKEATKAIDEEENKNTGHLFLSAFELYHVPQDLTRLRYLKKVLFLFFFERKEKRGGKMTRRIDDQFELTHKLLCE